MVCVCECIIMHNVLSELHPPTRPPPAVRYHLSEDPKSLLTVKLPDQSYTSVLISLSLDARVVAIATTTRANSSILLYSTSSGDLATNLQNVHRGECMCV